MKNVNAAPQPAEPVKVPSDEKGWKLGNLLTLNKDGYPALGSLFVQIWEGDYVVALVYGESRDEVLSRANARLIAASPDMLHALNLALEYWQDRQQRYKNRAPVWVQEARAAIAKALGETK